MSTVGQKPASEANKGSKNSDSNHLTLRAVALKFTRPLQIELLSVPSLRYMPSGSCHSSLGFSQPNLRKFNHLAHFGSVEAVPTGGGPLAIGVCVPTNSQVLVVQASAHAPHDEHHGVASSDAGNSFSEQQNPPFVCF
eukprot:TRINITY_DN31132_c0_g1_i1.p1 TRINITY_DN31132_c0_g1~~TRINITY_DN31132_c0_g1_i1.p1  ORF type:complete len:138 (-),score=3.49 TRINITY_DN31132_c0_g1_i1:132-545(-)